MIELIDSHCHLDDDRFEGHHLEVIHSARQVGIKHFIVPATTQRRWPLLRQLQQAHGDVSIAYGYHPMFMPHHEHANMQQLEAKLTKHHAVAVGECGLDFFNAEHDKKEQIAVFEQQLSVAKNLDLPCIIHSRKSLDTVLSILRKHQLKGGVIHSFSGSVQQANQLIDLGFTLGIAATVCFDRAKKLQQVVKSVPLESIVLESDAPDQSGPDYRGQLNQPSFMLSQLNKVAELKHEEISYIAQKVFENSKNLFALKLN